MPQSILEWVSLIAGLTALAGVILTIVKVFRINPMDEASAADIWESTASRSATRASQLLDQLMDKEQEVLIIVRGAGVLTRQIKRLGEEPDWNIFAYKDEITKSKTRSK